MTTIVRFEDAKKQFGQEPVLTGLNCQIEEGETIVLMGPSGCGKTTMLRCINGLETLDTGKLFVRGVDLTSPPKSFSWSHFRSEIGVVFQQFNLFPHLTVMENITLGPLKVKRISKDEACDKAQSLLDTVGLSNKADRYPRHLSGGEKQRVAIARALAMSNNLLLLDEPTSALDPVMSAEVLHTIQDLAHKGITLVIVTHEVHFACRVADRIFFLNNGSVEVEGTPEFFLKGLEHPIAKRYFELLWEDISSEKKN
jgi:ABC-type polar amino acid transport system ATPase subunit